MFAYEEICLLAQLLQDHKSDYENLIVYMLVLSNFQSFMLMVLQFNMIFGLQFKLLAYGIRSSYNQRKNLRPSRLSLASF